MKNAVIALLCLAGAAVMAGCHSEGMVYRPYPQVLPQHIKKLAVQPFVNKTDKFGLEDKLTLDVVDAFSRDATYPVVPESQATGWIVGEIRRYILTPIQYDTSMVPTVYKLEVLLRVRFYDKLQNAFLWEEPALAASQTYSAPTLPGGMTEEQAQELVWQLLAQDIVTRTIAGFGSISSVSPRKTAPVSPVAPQPQGQN